MPHELEDRDRLIRQLAYELWQAEGEPKGRQDEYWHRAAERVDAETQAASPARHPCRPRARSGRPALPRACRGGWIEETAGYRRAGRWGRSGSGLGRVALDDLVQFPAIQPHPATSRAVVDLDALPLADDEIDAADRTLHPLHGHGVRFQTNSATMPARMAQTTV